MSITYTLPNFPLKDQRYEQTQDGKAPENGDYDCVPESIAACAQFFDGGYISGDWLKDEVKGDAYHGGMAAAEFVAFCATHLQMRLTPVDARNAALVARIHTEVGTNHRPVVLTIPSQWGETLAQLGWTETHITGWTHVVVACGVGPGMVRLMNPWTGAFQDVTDQWLIDRMCFDEIWIAERIGTGGTTVALDLTGLGSGFQSLARIRNASQTGGGERGLGGGVSFATLTDEAVLYWNANTKRLSDKMPGTVVNLLWSLVTSLRAQAGKAQADATLAAQQRDEAHAAQTAAQAAAQQAQTALDQAKTTYTQQAQTLQKQLDAALTRATTAEGLLAKVTATGNGNGGNNGGGSSTDTAAAQTAIADAEKGLDEVLHVALNVPSTTKPTA